jgi:nucleotide-binding universal stress UspA family protein
MAMNLSRNKVESKNLKARITRLVPNAVWAIDSSQINEVEVKKFQTVLKALKFSDDGILSTTIFSPFDLGWLVRVDKALKKKTYENISEIIKKQWSKFSLSFNKKSVLVAESSSNREKILALLQCAKKSKAKLIAVGSGVASRSKLMGIGSFSEALITMSPVPVLVLSESAKPISQVKKILFPTDFSPLSYLNFKKVVQFAKTYDAEVFLYHFLDLETGPLMYGIPWGYEVKWLDDYWRVQADHKRQEGGKWKAWAEKQNTRCHFIVDSKLGSFNERVLENLKENKIDILTLGIKRGPLSQVILGRNVRELLATSTCPILTIHTVAAKKQLHS